MKNLKIKLKEKKIINETIEDINIERHIYKKWDDRQHNYFQIIVPMIITILLTILFSFFLSVILEINDISVYIILFFGNSLFFVIIATNLYIERKMKKSKEKYNLKIKKLVYLFNYTLVDENLKLLKVLFNPKSTKNFNFKNSNGISFLDILDNKSTPIIKYNMFHLFKRDLSLSNLFRIDLIIKNKGSKKNIWWVKYNEKKNKIEFNNEIEVLKILHDICFVDYNLFAKILLPQSKNDIRITNVYIKNLEELEIRLEYSLDNEEVIKTSPLIVRRINENLEVFPYKHRNLSNFFKENKSLILK